jgi:hypothetical protein
MKIKIVGNWELLLTPETWREEKILRDTNALGHVHFVCKAFMRDRKAKRAALLLTPSLIRWQRPPEPKKRLRTAERSSKSAD